MVLVVQVACVPNIYFAFFYSFCNALSYYKFLSFRNKIWVLGNKSKFIQALISTLKFRSQREIGFKTHHKLCRKFLLLVYGKIWKNLVRFCNQFSSENFRFIFGGDYYDRPPQLDYHLYPRKKPIIKVI